MVTISGVFTALFCGLAVWLLIKIITTKLKEMKQKEDLEIAKEDEELSDWEEGIGDIAKNDDTNDND